MIALLNVTDFTGIGLQPWWINFDSIVGWHAGQMMGTALGASFVLCHCCFTVPLQSMGGMCQYQMFQGNVRTGDRPSDNITQIKLAVHMLTVTNSLKQSAREWVCKRPFTQHNTGLKDRCQRVCVLLSMKKIWYGTYIFRSMHQQSPQCVGTLMESELDLTKNLKRTWW